MKGTGKLVASLVFVGCLVVASIGGFAAGLRPLLGLDLIGGLSVVLQGPPSASKGVMELALNRIRDRVDALGVAEPDISLLGSNTIQVQLPGLGAQGRVEKRGTQWCAVSASGKALGCFASQAAAQAKAKAVSVQRVLEVIGKTARLEERPVLQIVLPGGRAASAGAGVAAGTPYSKIRLSPCVFSSTLTSCPARQNIWTFFDSSGNAHFNPQTSPKYELGPVVITGAQLTKAAAVYQTASQTNTTQVGWAVDFNLNSSGTAAFARASTVANRYYQQNPSNPPPQASIAILVDKAVISAPVVIQPITGGTGQITGLNQQEAQNLAVELQSGSLPVNLAQKTVETVSPTLGKQSLRAGLIAGIAGLIALMVYLAYYYRLLGLVTWVGMAVWGTLALALVSALGRGVGYALTLAGIAGLIVSIGITADSYIVFYERLKDEVRHGRTLRAAVQPAFRRAWRTIVAADIVTILAAAALYVLSIGSVRGFALTLGVSTLLDMGVVWFYKRPTAFLIARSPWLTTLRGMGLRAGVAQDRPELAPVAGGSE